MLKLQRSKCLSIEVEFQFNKSTHCLSSSAPWRSPRRTPWTFHVGNGYLLLPKYAHKAEAVPLDNLANVFLTAFNTSYARLYLYGIMELLNQVMYHDTDSIVYVPDLYSSLSDYLGDLTDECWGNHIEGFVSAGLKNYAYRTQSGETVCKVRDFCLNYDTCLSKHQRPGDEGSPHHD